MSNYRHVFRRGMIYVTLRCNLSCPWCHQRNRPARANWQDATLAECQRFIDRLVDQKVHLESLTISGGEPGLWKPLPFLVSYVRRSGVAKTVRIITNGTNVDAAHYGSADVIDVTDYGAANRLMIQMLKRDLGDRVRVLPSVHLPFPFDHGFPREEVLPAVCHQKYFAYLGGKVYPCCPQALELADSGVSVESPFVAILSSRPPDYPDLCCVCFGNKKITSRENTPLTWQCFLWGCPESVVTLTFPSITKRLRRLYTWWRHWRGY